MAVKEKVEATEEGAGKSCPLHRSRGKALRTARRSITSLRIIVGGVTRATAMTPAAGSVRKVGGARDRGADRGRGGRGQEQPRRNRDHDDDNNHRARGMTSALRSQMLSHNWHRPTKEEGTSAQEAWTDEPRRSFCHLNSVSRRLGWRPEHPVSH